MCFVSLSAVQVSRQVVSGASFLRQRWAKHTQPKVHLSDPDDDEAREATDRASHEQERCPAASSPGRSRVWGENIELLQFWQTCCADLSRPANPPPGLLSR